MSFENLGIIDWNKKECRTCKFHNQECDLFENFSCTSNSYKEYEKFKQNKKNT